MNCKELFEKVKNKSISPDNFLTNVRELSNQNIRTGIKISDETTIFRTRLYNYEAKPKLISELSYPPKEITILQRANNKGEQIFYGSFGYKTAFVESKVKANEYLVVSEWVNIDPLVLMQIGLTTLEASHYGKNNLIHDGINKLIHDIFTWRGNELYEYSSIIAYHYLRGDLISGILYPSISSDFESTNVAIHTNFVDKSMRLVQAYLYHVNKVSQPEEYEVNEIAYAIPDSEGNLLWENGRVEQLYF